MRVVIEGPRLERDVYRVEAFILDDGDLVVVCEGGLAVKVEGVDRNGDSVLKFAGRVLGVSGDEVGGEQGQGAGELEAGVGRVSCPGQLAGGDGGAEEPAVEYRRMCVELAHWFTPLRS